MNKKKLVLFGYGKMGKNHFRVIRESGLFELLAVCDPTLSPISHKNIDGVLQLNEPTDAVLDDADGFVVAVDTKNHFELGSRLIPLKKPILMEKPLAATNEKARTLCELISKHQTPFAVGHLERFNPTVLKLKEILESGILGEPIHFSITRVGGYPHFVSDQDNVLSDLAVHDFDVLNFLVGKMDVAASICHSTWKAGIWDTAEIMAKSPTGISASLHVNWITPTKIRTIRITGSRGVCFADYIMQTCHLLGGDLLRAQGMMRSDFSGLSESYKNTDKIEFGIKKAEPLNVQLIEFYKLMNGEPSEVCTPGDALYAVEIVEKALNLGRAQGITK